MEAPRDQDNVFNNNNIRERIRNLALNNADNGIIDAGNNGDLEQVVVHQNQDGDNLQVGDGNRNNGFQVQGGGHVAPANNIQDQFHGQNEVPLQQDAINQQQANLFGRQQNPLALQNVQNADNGQQIQGNQENPIVYPNNVRQLLPRPNQAVDLQQQANLFDRQQNPLAVQDAPVNLRIGNQGNQPHFPNRNVLGGDGNNQNQANQFERQRQPLLANNNAIGNAFGGQRNNANVQNVQGNFMPHIARFNVTQEVQQNVGNIPHNNFEHIVGQHGQDQRGHYIPNHMGVNQPQNLNIPNANHQNVHVLGNNNTGDHPQPLRRQSARNSRDFPYARSNRNAQMRHNCDKMASFLWSMAKQATYVPRRRDSDNDENNPET